MRKIAIALLAAMALGAAAQQPQPAPAQPETAQETSAATAVEIGDNDNATLVQEMNETAAPAEPAPVQPVAQPAAQPADDGGSMLVHAAMVILMLVCSVIVWVLARRMVDKSHNEQLAALQASNEQMQQRCKQLEDAMRQLDANMRAALASQPAGRQHTAAPAAKRKAATPEPKAEPVPVTLYLPRPDATGTFASASSAIERGNSIFVLTTTQGSTTGTFEVIPDAEVHRMALMMPTETLTRACTGDDIQVSAGKRAIVTDKPGQAHLDTATGKWQVTVLANIHYE